MFVIIHKDMFDYIYHKILKQPYALEVSSLKKQPGQPLVVFLHGIGNSGAVWSETIKKLPKDVQYIAPDLLGFGSSDKPDYIDYDIKLHARSVVKTIRGYRFNPSKIIIVGHSLGSLVAIEIAKIYSHKINGLILCSPPFYVPSKGNRIPSSDDILTNLYQYAEQNPDNFLGLATLAKKYRIVTDDLKLNKNNIGAYMNTLRSSIINQASLRDAINLPENIQIHIIRGVLDPLVLQKNIKMLKRLRPGTVVASVIASHDIASRYNKTIKQDIETILKT